MKKNCIFLSIIIIVTFSTIYAQDDYYYGGGNTIPLVIDSSLVTIKFNDSIPTTYRNALIDNIGRIDQVQVDNHAIEGFLAFTLSSSDNYFTFLDSLDTIDGIDFSEPYYRATNDSALLVGYRFCVAFEEDVTEDEIDSINSIFNVDIDYEVMGMDNVFVINNTKTSGYRILELANIYYELDETRYAHP